MRSQLAQSGTHALGIGGQVERSERTNLAVADEAGIGLHAHYGAVEDGDGLATAPFVGAFVQRKFNAVGEDAGNFHVTMQNVVQGFGILLNA